MSGTAGNAQANLTADVTAFIAAMRAAGQASAKMALDTATAAAAASAALNNLTGAAVRTATATRTAGVASAQLTGILGQLGLSASFTSRKISALIDESLAGRWRQAEGSLASLVGTMAAANPILTAEVAAAAAAAGAVAYLAYQWYETEQAVKHAVGAMVINNSAVPDSLNQVRQDIANMRQEWGLWPGEARKTELAIASIGGPAANFHNQIRAIAIAMKEGLGGDASKYAEELYHAFNEGAKGAESWADKTIHLNESQKNQVDTLIRAGHETEAIKVIIDAADSAFVKQAEVVHKAAKEWNAYDAAVAKAAAAPELIAVPDQPKVPRPNGLQATQQAVSPELEEAARSTDQLNQKLRERQVLTLQLHDAELQLAAATGAEGRAAAQNAIIEAKTKLAEIHTATEEQEHDRIMGHLQDELAATRDDAQARVSILQQVAAEDARYYGETNARARASHEQYIDGQRTAANESLRIKLEQLTGEQDAERDHIDKVVALQRQKVALLAAVENDHRSEYQQELNALTNYEREAADQQVKIQIDRYRQQQSAAGDNYAQVLKIEDNILAVLKAHYGEDSQNYQQELDKQVEIKRRSDEQKIELARQYAATVKELEASITTAIDDAAKTSKGKSGSNILLELFGLDDSSLSAAKAKLDQLQSAYSTSMQAIKAEEAAAAPDPVRYQAALEQETEANIKFAAAVIEAQSQAALATKQVWDSAWNSVDQGANSFAAKLLVGQRQTSAQIADEVRGMAEKMIESSLKAAEHWAADRLYEAAFANTQQVAMTSAQALQTAIRTAQSSGAISAESAQQLLLASRVAASQAAQTTATATGTAARETITNQGVLADIASFLIRSARWVGSELGMTTATTAGATARNTASATEVSVSAAQEAANLALALSYAAVGAVAAGASVAAIPVIGWTLVAPTTESTYGELAGVASLASLDVGAWEVPHDMVAKIHEGEAVVPKTYAEGLRGQANGGLGGSASSGWSGDANFSSVNHFHGGTNNAQLAAMVEEAQRNTVKYMINAVRNGNVLLPGRGLG